MAPASPAPPLGGPDTSPIRSHCACMHVCACVCVCVCVSDTSPIRSHCACMHMCVSACVVCACAHACVCLNVRAHTHTEAHKQQGMCRSSALQQITCASSAQCGSTSRVLVASCSVRHSKQCRQHANRATRLLQIRTRSVQPQLSDKKNAPSNPACSMCRRLPHPPAPSQTCTAHPLPLGC